MTLLVMLAPFLGGERDAMAQRAPVLDVFQTLPSALSTLPPLFLRPNFAGAGDVNADGFDDLIVSATDQATHRGRAVLFLGSATGFGATPSWVVGDASHSKFFGLHVSSAGDVNGDGFDDVLVSDPGEPYSIPDPNNPPLGVISRSSGTAYLYLGSATGLSTTPIWSAHQPESHFGVSIAAAGDVDGDGFEDVLVGTPGTSRDQSIEPVVCKEGAVYLYRGNSSGLEVQPAWVARPTMPYSCFGYGLAAIGDANGDGFADIAISAMFQDNAGLGNGVVHVYHGSPTGLRAQPDQLLTEYSNVGGYFNVHSLAFGDSLSRAGDVNGDGYDDLLVGSVSIQGSQVTLRNYLYYGSATGLQGPNVFATPRGNGPRALLGVKGGGDINGDGIDDVLVARGEDQRGVRMYQGRSGIGQAFLSRPAWIEPFPSMTSGGEYEYGAFIGDVNQDGHDDVAFYGKTLGIDILFGAPNPAPEAIAQTIVLTRDTPVLFELLGADLHDDLTYSLVTPPQHGTLTSYTSGGDEVRYAPVDTFVGQDTFTFKVSDPYGGEDTGQVTLVVEMENRAPELFSPMRGTITLLTGQTFTLQVSARDLDADSMSYEFSPLLDGATLDAASGEFSWTPSNAQEGMHEVIFSVSDGELRDEVTITFEVVLDTDHDTFPDTSDPCPDMAGEPGSDGCPLPAEEMGMPADMAMPVEDMHTADMSAPAEEMGAPLEPDMGVAPPHEHPCTCPQEEGCAGCSSGARSTPSPVSVLGLLALTFLSYARRRRARRSSAMS